VRRELPVLSECVIPGSGSDVRSLLNRIALVADELEGSAAGPIWLMTRSPAGSMSTGDDLADAERLVGLDDLTPELLAAAVALGMAWRGLRMSFDG
jgi:hypothetical protein